MQLPITLMVIVRNAEKNLRKLIEYHRPYFKEILVAVQDSTDGTYAVASEMADVAIKRRAKGFVEPDRNYVASMANNEFVLMLDDDELLSKEALQNLPDLIQSGVDIVWFKRKNFVDGVDIFPLLGDDAQCRMWKRGSVRWSDTMHQHPEGANNAKVMFVDSPIEHYRTFETLKKSNMKRNAVAQNQQQIDMQNRFVLAVEDYLVKHPAVKN